MRWLVRTRHAGLAGAFAGLALGALVDRVPLLVLFAGGWAYGLVVLGLLRLFPVARWGRPVAGLVAGPVPVVLLRVAGVEVERPSDLLLAAGLGLVVGLLDAARDDGPEAPRRPTD